VIRKDFENFKQGKVNIYETDGSGKSAGLKIKLKYPLEWTTENGERLHIV